MDIAGQMDIAWPKVRITKAVFQRDRLHHTYRNSLFLNYVVLKLGVLTGVGQR